MELCCVSIEVDFYFGLQQERFSKTDLSGLKLSVSITNPCSKLLCTEVREMYQIFRNTGRERLIRTRLIRSST